MNTNYFRIAASGAALVLLAGLSYVWAGGLIFADRTQSEVVPAVTDVAAARAANAPYPPLTELFPGRNLDGIPPDVIDPDAGGKSFNVSIWQPGFPKPADAVPDNANLPDATPPDIIEPDDNGSSFSVGINQQGFTPNLDFCHRQNQFSTPAEPGNGDKPVETP